MKSLKEKTKTNYKVTQYAMQYKMIDEWRIEFQKTSIRDEVQLQLIERCESEPVCFRSIFLTKLNKRRAQPN